VNTGGIASSRGRFGRKAWGRNKRWEYWNVMTPAHIIALTVSNIDYACVNEVWVYDRATQQQASKVALRIPARGVKLPGTLGAGEVRASGGGVDIARSEARRVGKARECSC